MPQRVAKLIEISSMIIQQYSTAELGRFIMIYYRFMFVWAKSASSSVRMSAKLLRFFNCTRPRIIPTLAYSEINTV